MNPQPIRIMPCLDRKDGRVVKSVCFVDLHDAGDPAECARACCAAGADELAMLDITATIENNPIRLDVARRVVRVVTVPFTVGGGIHDVTSAAKVFESAPAASPLAPPPSASPRGCPNGSVNSAPTASSRRWMWTRSQRGHPR